MIGALILTSAGLGTAAADDPVVRERRDLAAGETEWRARMAPGQSLDVKGVMGAIDLVAATGDEAVVTIERGDLPRVELVTSDRGYTLCAVKPSDNPKKPNECAPALKGRLTHGMKKEDPPVRFKVQLPAGVDFIGKLEFGDIDARPAPGNVTLHTRSGNIKVKDSGQGGLLAKTFGGDLDVDLSPVKAEADRIVNLGIHAGTARVVMPDVPFRCTIWSSRLETRIPFKPGIVRDTFDCPAGEPSKTTMLLDVAVGKVQIRRP